MAEVSIIIVSHNGLHETTAPCIDSLLRCPACRDFEVVVVDNNSTDDTASWLKKRAEGEPRLKCVFNRINRGFSGGNNDGLHLASGDYIILLNSDCIVEGDWVSGLIEHLRRDPSIGLAGPVSNSVGNEQKILTSGSTPEEILLEGRDWASRSRGDWFESSKLVFFCVATRRDVLEKVGFLDESFGMGFYEDDDYCIRTLNAGFRLVCVEDVFVYHRGGGSFDRSGFETRKMMKHNRLLLERKHGIRYSPVHARLRQLELISSYLDCAEQPQRREQSIQTRSGEASTRTPESPQVNSENRENLLFRIENRIRLAESLMPRGPLKRFFYRKRLQDLKNRLGSLR